MYACMQAVGAAYFLALASIPEEGKNRIDERPERFQADIEIRWEDAPVRA